MHITSARNYALNETTGYPEKVGVENWYIMKGLNVFSWLELKLESVLLSTENVIRAKGAPIIQIKKGTLQVRQCFLYSILFLASTWFFF